MFAATWAVWLAATGGLYALSPVAGIVLAGIAVAQHSSLQHEALHGHPFRSRRWNAALATPSPGLTVPYGRFRETHLAHHRDPLLTDPYDDPESNFLDPAVWAGLGRPLRALLAANNTLAGRIVLGPLIGNARWLGSEARAMAAGRRAVIRDWGLHLAGLVPVLAWVWVAAMPWWAFLAAVWIGQGLLKIRTYLEHRAHALPRARTVVVEDRGPLALMFLNNNLHAVHHAHPGVAWYRLPALYRAGRAQYLRRNGGYRYAGYGEILARHLLRAKDPVAHPLRPAPLEQAAKDGALAAVVEEGHPLVRPAA